MKLIKDTENKKGSMAVCCCKANLIFLLLFCLRRQMVSVASKTYRSHLLSVPNGPNPANVQGANPLMLL